MKFLKNDFKNNDFKRVYLLYGEERYLVNHYARDFTELLADTHDALMNRDSFDGKQPVAQIMDAANTLPFLSDKRLIYARDTRLFVSGRKDDAEAMAAYIPQIPDSTVLVFVEAEAEKRSRLYKKVAEYGRVVEFTSPSESELITWVKNLFNKKGHTINTECSKQLLHTVLHNMEAVYAEADKLSDYAALKKEITAGDISAVCSPSLETRIFDLVDAVGGRRCADALVMYRHMLIMKEQPLMILTMMARQFRMILQCKAGAEKKIPHAEMAKLLELRSFIVEVCLKQGRTFSVGRLVNALEDCADTDIRIKRGLLEAETGVEMLIVRYAS